MTASPLSTDVANLYPFLSLATTAGTWLIRQGPLIVREQPRVSRAAAPPAMTLVTKPPSPVWGDAAPRDIQLDEEKEE